LAVSEISDEPQFSLATLPPTPGQRRLALIITAVLLLAFGLTVRFATIELPRIDAFIPSLDGIFCVSGLITAALLFSQFSIIRSRALLVLASGYLFTALIVVPHALTFPKAFSPTGLLGAGLQSTRWLYIFWHTGFAVALLGYAWLANEKRAKHTEQASMRSEIAWSVAVVAGLVCGLAWMATAGERFLPRLFLDRPRVSPFEGYAVAWLALILALALAVLWRRRRSVLNQWLMVVACALISELVLLSNTRFDLGWYAGRMFALVAATTILIVLLAETTRLYARLARSNMMLQRERNNKLMNLAAMAASISHEVRQPLMAISMNGGAALQFLGRAAPDLGEIRSALNAIVADSHRANQVFNDISDVFRGGNQRREPVDMNEMTLEVLRILRGDIEEHRVAAHAELASGLPHLIGHRGQLQEVLVNLINNAIEAMDEIKDRPRTLLVKTERHGSDEVALTVEDSGPGIEPDRLAGIFDAFVTSKFLGTGLGLAICQIIVERHGGQISARSSEKAGGALFRCILPIKPATKPVVAPL
jgi:signal transduction histidine kinase